MSASHRRLPARPSLEQLRKQAREKLEALRIAEPTAKLADAQHALAREYGFESWPQLVHHVEAVLSADRLARFERFADDLLAGYHGDGAALERLGAWFGDSHDHAQRQIRVRGRIDALQRGTPEPTVADVRLLVARQYGFETWAAFAQSLAQPLAGSAGMRSSSAPPFFRIDAERNMIRPEPPLDDADWDTLFAIMEEQGITGIATAAITDRALERLARLSFVTDIELDGAQRFSDDGLLELARMPQLRSLNLSGWHSPITDRGLEVLKHLHNLERLTMCWPQRVTDAGLVHLRACDRLESVDLMGTHTGDGAIDALRGKPQLRMLKTGRRVTDAGIPALHDIPLFRQWTGAEPQVDLMSFDAGDAPGLMLDGPVTDHGLRALAGLDGLRSVSLFWHSDAFTGEGLSALAVLPNLIHLGCEGKRCDDAALRAVASIPQLRMLMAQGMVAGDDGFVALSRSRSIEYIWGRECPNLTGRGFSALKDMPALRGIAVSCRQVDDDSLATLPDFPSLTDLLPMDVSDHGFRHVGRCKRLERLWCMYCRDTGDVATAHIAALPLTYYYAGMTRITDRSLEILSRMHTLEHIELVGIAGITNAGIAALSALPRLRVLSVDDSPNVTGVSRR